MASGDDMVVVGFIGADNKLTLYAYDVNLGAAKWNTTITGDTFTINLQINNGKVFVAYPPNLYAVNLEDGSLAWKATDSGSTAAKISVFSKKHLLVIKPSALTAYSVETGNAEWSIALLRGKEDVFFDSETNLIYLLLGTKAKAINDENGSVLWEKDLNMPSTITSQDGMIYFVNDKQGVTLNAFDILRQKTIWQVNLDSPSEHLFIWKDKIIDISTETIISMEQKSGDKNWSYMLPWGHYRPPVSIGNVAFLRNADSNQVIAMDLNEGDIIGRLNLPAQESMLMVVRDDDLLSIDSLDPVLVLYTNNQIFVYGEK